MRLLACGAPWGLRLCTLGAAQGCEGDRHEPAAAGTSGLRHAALLVTRDTALFGFLPRAQA